MARAGIALAIGCAAHASGRPNARAEAQPRAEEAQPPAEDVFEPYTEPIPGVNWEQMHPHFAQMVDRIFQRSGWTDEIDDYARGLFQKIAAIPPWDLKGRLQAITDEVAKRYGLTPQQASAFKGALIRESAGLLLRHGPALWDQAHEALQTRARRLPYRAEQVARWAKDAAPVYDEIEASVDRLAVELNRSLTPEKRELLQKDMNSFRKRQAGFRAMNRRWAEGGWHAAEWGLEADPIQMKGAPADPAPIGAAPGAGAGSKGQPLPSAGSGRPGAERAEAAVVPTRWVEHDPATWIALVLEYRDRYAMDAGQMDTAWSIHGEMVERAARFAASRGGELESIPGGQRATHPAYAPVRELFEELRGRLESLPTSTQRSDAKP